MGGDPDDHWSLLMSDESMFSTKVTGNTPTANLSAEELLRGLGVEDPAEIATSASARVFSGTDQEAGRPVAVKVLTNELDELDLVRFEREQERLTWRSVFKHPNVVTVIRSGITDAGLPYLVMDHAGGGSLADRLTDGPPLSWVEVLSMGVDLSGALESAHQERVLHRDIKPENILVDGTGRVLLNNVGLSALGGERANDEARAESTEPFAFELAALAHRPPETLSTERRTAQSDIYSLASTLHELFSETPPFIRTGDTDIKDVTDRIVLEPPPDLRLWGVPAPVARAIERGLSKDPGQRFESAREFGQALEACQAQLELPVTEMYVPQQSAPTAPRPIPAKERPQHLRRRRLASIAAGAAVLVGAITAGPFLVDAGRDYFASSTPGTTEVAQDAGADTTTASSLQPAVAATSPIAESDATTVPTRPAVTVADAATSASVPELLSEPLPGRPEIVDDLPLLPAVLPAYTEYKRVADANSTFGFEVPVQHVDLISIPGQVVSSLDNDAALANEAVSATIVSGSQIDPSQWQPDQFLDDIHALRVTPQNPCPELKREPFADGPFVGLLRAASCQNGQLLIVDIVVTNPEQSMILFLGFQLTDERDFAALDNTLATFGPGDIALLPTS